MAKSKTKKSKEKLVECQRCSGVGEEPGAPERPDEVMLCSDCEGKGAVPREKAIRQLAKDEYENEGSIEIDDGATLSEGDDNGCYVQAWVWVSFAGQPGLDKQPN